MINESSPKQGICPACNNKSIRKYRNYAVCDVCDGAPMNCYNSNSVAIVRSAEPHEDRYCSACGETNTSPENGHMLYLL